MRNLEELSSLVKKGISDMKMPETAENLYNPISYILEDGGKRIRPVLLLLAADSFGADPSVFVNQALALEIFHNFTLLHDDIMDRAPIRRGRPTVHLKWNDNAAILSGDAMVIMAYRLLVTGLPDRYISKVMQIFNKAAIEVCEGQQYDIDFENRDDVSIDEYNEMIRLKTAVLLAASARIGAVLAGAGDEECDIIYKFAEQLGLAFQIQDDLLDTYGDSAVFGKKIGGDIAVGKKTFLMISALSKANPEQRAVILESRDYNVVRGLYDKLGVAEIAKNAISDHFSSAMDLLSKLPYPTAGLEQFARSLMGRNN